MCGMSHEVTKVMLDYIILDVSDQQTDVPDKVPHAHSTCDLIYLI